MQYAITSEKGLPDICLCTKDVAFTHLKISAPSIALKLPIFHLIF